MSAARLPLRAREHCGIVADMYRLLLAVVITGASACSDPRPASPPPAPATTAAVATSDAEELRAFAKLYGYIRFFHPSDEAARADWNAVAIEGARRVVLGRTQADLLLALRETFGPLAPTLLVYREDERPPAAPMVAGGSVMAWQHEGFGLGESSALYRSGRIGRPLDMTADGPAWAGVSGEVSAAVVRGKRVRLRGWARVDGADPHGKAQLWLRIDGKQPGSEFFDNMGARPITSTKWVSATIEAPPVGSNVARVAFGGIAVGSGAALFDDFALEVADAAAKAWTAIPIPNPGFEAGEQIEGWTAAGSGRTFSVVEGGRRGGAALKVRGRADLFDERPALGETFERPLGARLACRVVLGLPLAEVPATAALRTKPSTDAKDAAVRAAAVIIAWNVLRHFYPYHDVIGENWNDVLDDAIRDVLDDAGPEDLHLTLRRLVHRLHDGHARVSGETGQTPVLPIRLALVDGVYVVLAADPGIGIQRGDEMVSVDGVPVADLHARGIGLASGSPQWIDHLLLAWGFVTEGPDGSTATIELRRGTVTRTIMARRRVGVTPLEFNRAAFERLTAGVLYVDLDRATEEEIHARLPELARAAGVVFDMRGYPKAGWDWLRHLVRSPDRAKKWMLVPHIIRPDYERVTAFTEYSWNLMPAEPRISGQVVFLTGSGAISYAEAVLGIVEAYRLGAIVGTPTAGANGNINLFEVPGAFKIAFTGMKVTRLDGRQHHLLGVQPTHPVRRTLAGIRAGRDEELEAALRLMRPN
jgi:hypothetical protein